MRSQPQLRNDKYIMLLLVFKSSILSVLLSFYIIVVESKMSKYSQRLVARIFRLFSLTASVRNDRVIEVACGLDKV